MKWNSYTAVRTPYPAIWECMEVCLYFHSRVNSMKKVTGPCTGYLQQHAQAGSTYLGIFIKGRHLTTPISGFSLVSSFSARLSTTLLGPATLLVLCCCCANCPTTALESRATADVWGTYLTHSDNNTMLHCEYQKINTAQIHQTNFG